MIGLKRLNQLLDEFAPDSFMPELSNNVQLENSGVWKRTSEVEVSSIILGISFAHSRYQELPRFGSIPVHIRRKKAKRVLICIGMRLHLRNKRNNISDPHEDADLIGFPKCS